MLDAALLFGQAGQARALFFLDVDPGFPGVLHGEDAGDAFERPPQRVGVSQIALDNLDATRFGGAGGVAARLSRHAAEPQSLTQSARATDPPCCPVIPA